MQIITKFSIIRSLSFFILYFLSLNVAHALLAPTASGYVPVNGGKIYYASYGPSTQPIVVLHGGPGLDSGYLLPQMTELAYEQQVVFYDQRGSGKSLGFKLDSKTINMSEFMEDLDKLQAKLGYKKIILLGHSWGGLLAMRYATLHPEKVSALILVSSAPSNSVALNKFFVEYAKRTAPMKKVLDGIENSPAYKHGDPVTVEDYYRRVFSVYFFKAMDVHKLSLNFTPQSAVSGSKVAELMGQTYLLNYNLIPELKTLRVPTLIVHGVNDIVPIETARETHAAIAGSKMVEISNCDHFPYIEQPMEFFKAVQDFVRSND
jgi:proline iminopeptidase